MSMTDRDLLDYCTKKTRMIQESIGLFVVIVAITAGLSWGYAFYSFSNHNIYIALIGALLGITIIGAVDRFLVGTSDTKWAIAARVPVTVAVALIIAVPLELYIFKDDINSEIQRLSLQENGDLTAKIDSLKSSYNLRVESLNKFIENKDSTITALEERAWQEGMGHDSGTTSGRAGWGPIFKQIEHQIAEAKKIRGEYRSEKKSLLEQKEKEFNQYNATYLERKVELSQNILTQYTALQSLKERDKYANQFAIALMIFIIMIELSPILLKLFVTKNEYHTLERVRREQNIKVIEEYTKKGEALFQEESHISPEQFTTLKENQLK